MGKLAINGGEPLRTKAFPAWPMWDKEDEAAVLDVLHSGKWGCSGIQRRVYEFEKKFAEFMQAKYSVCCVNGTAALELALMGAGVKPGDEVIVPPYTFIASASSILMVKAIPVFVDIDPETYCLDPKKIEAAITDKTTAILAVHIGGGPCDMDAICAIAKKHNLKVIEDAAQAHGASWDGKPVGTIGDVGTFSFQSSKNLTAGEGGIVISNNKEIGLRAWSLANVGRIPEGGWYQHELLGWNYRMTEWQGAILLSQMRNLKTQMAKREENAKFLSEELAKIDGITPQKRLPKVTSHAYHIYIFRYDSKAFKGASRNKFVQALNAEGIGASNGYVPLYKENAIVEDAVAMLKTCNFENIPDYSKVSCPVAEHACANEAVWIMQNQLLGSHEDMLDIVAAVKKIHDNAAEL